MASPAAWAKIPDVVIPLATLERKPSGKSRGNKKLEYYKTINDEYVTKVLEGIGADVASLRNRRCIEKEAPLAKCNIQAFWADNSVIASSLRVAQPPIVVGPRVEDVIKDTSAVEQGELSSAAAAARAADAELSAEIAKTGQRVVTFEKLRVKDPEIPTAATVHAWLGLQPPWAPGEQQQSVDSQDLVNSALDSLRRSDIAHSQGVDASLVEEMAHMHSRSTKHSRAVAYDTEQDEVAAQASLADLKCKFVLPFACAAGGSSTVPWQVAQQDGLGNEVSLPDEFVEEVRQPITVTLQQISDEASSFARKGLPLRLLTVHQEPGLFKSIRDHLTHSDLTRLIGLMAHLIYWTAFGHLHGPDERLRNEQKHSLLVTVHDCWTRLIAPLRDASKYMGVETSLAMPALMLAAKRGVERVFAIQYPTLFAKHGLAMQVVERINLQFMNLFDPDCAYAHFAGLDSSPEAVKLWRRHNQVLAARGLGSSKRTRLQMDRTTPAVQVALDGGVAPPGDARTRALLRKTASEATLRPRRPVSAAHRTTTGPYPAVAKRVASSTRATSPPIAVRSPRGATAAGADSGDVRDCSEFANAEGTEAPWPQPMDEWRRTALLRVARQRICASNNGDADGGAGAIRHRTHVSGRSSRATSRTVADPPVVGGANSSGGSVCSVGNSTVRKPRATSARRAASADRSSESANQMLRPASAARVTPAQAVARGARPSDPVPRRPFRELLQQPVCSSSGSRNARPVVSAWDGS